MVKRLLSSPFIFITRIMEGKEHYKYSANELKEISKIHASKSYKIDEALDFIMEKCLKEAYLGKSNIYLYLNPSQKTESIKTILKYKNEISDNLKSLGYKITFEKPTFIQEGEYLYVGW